MILHFTSVLHLHEGSSNRNIFRLFIYWDTLFIDIKAFVSMYVKWMSFTVSGNCIITNYVIIIKWTLSSLKQQFGCIYFYKTTDKIYEFHLNVIQICLYSKIVVSQECYSRRSEFIIFVILLYRKVSHFLLSLPPAPKMNFSSRKYRTHLVA